MALEHSGGSDPDRILALLWRHERKTGDAKRPLGRKPILTVDAVVAAATALADAEGLPAMSMSRVAKSLGVGTMTLYTYIESKAELIDLMVDAALGERDFPAPGEPRPRGWRAQVELFAERTRAVYRRHPWLRQVSTIRPPLGPGLLAGSEYLISALSGTGLAPRKSSAAANAINAFVGAMVSYEVESEQVERASGKSHDAWWAERSVFWDEYFDQARYPSIVDVWSRGGYDYEDVVVDVYEFGFRRLLDGIQAMIDD
ncbi:TetR/AcrR family transcriptional regulator C-terminal domain-containing protein [Amycolatopsis anabasis]|uniref:TetR/AcrR family transcriptional regulator C-terminal domain-containing protein n=1 Tax=Amycolatopsis anabasis TaxID=1840409 RepID=UPI00131B7016|nr:TetR/AcrR family transcriptional regulator C-terminal domain-containing protein [Amycolatopsis anabasis]